MRLRTSVVCCVFLSLAVCLSVNADTQAAPGKLTAAQIVDRNVSARGGLQAWKAVQTISYTGKMQAGGKQNVELPIVIEMKRPRKTRIELEFNNDKAIQVYDGTKGWKLRPFLGRRQVEPFTPEEMKTASLESDLDGPLVDHAAKGTQVDLEGVEKVEGHDTYKLKLTMKDGQQRHVWVDAATFLEVKVEGIPRRLDGKMHPVEVYYRDYQNVSGLMVPYVLETVVQGVKQSHNMTIESVVLNPKLDDSLFMEPSAQVITGTAKPAARP